MSNQESEILELVSPEGAGAASVTQILVRWQAGDEAAFTELAPIVYGELKEHARRYLRQERRDHTLQGTALVHEVLMRLLDGTPINWTSRQHFVRLASRLMRRILVDHARARGAVKRGGGAVYSLEEMRERPAANAAGGHHELDELLEATLAANMESAASDVCAIDEALEKLGRIDARQAHLVELRFFGGMTIEETAIALGISDATVKRDWLLARAWLQRELKQVG
jgi:RNA polymerase sigma factor (TIGR02999 family)